MKINIKGIIDNKQIQFFKNYGVDSFTFDNRPTSFNFIQLKNMQEMMECDQADYRILFDRPSYIMLNETMSKLSTNSVELLSNVDDEKIISGYDFSAYYSDQNLLSYYRKIESLKKIIIPEQAALLLLNENNLFNLISRLKSEFNQLEIELLLNWSSQIDFSLLEEMNIDLISFELNQDIQQSYRMLDYDKVEKYMEEMKKLGITE